MPSRRTGFFQQDVAGELLVYDRSGARAHCLGSLGAFIYKRCDGKTLRATVEAEMASRFPGEPPELLQASLEELRERNLLEDAPALEEGRATRRRVLKALGVAALAVSISVPRPSQATSGICPECSTSTGCPDCPGTQNPDCNGACVCMAVYEVIGESCATDGRGGAVCVHLDSSSDPSLNLDCEVARANPSENSYFYVDCEGVGHHSVFTGPGSRFFYICCDCGA